MGQHLDRPIFLVGHARGGSTALGAIINFHSHVGPKPSVVQSAKRVTDLLTTSSYVDSHLKYSEYLEQKDIWFSYFPGKNIFTHMGSELAVDEKCLTTEQEASLRDALTTQLNTPRYLSKAPTNSFRLPALAHLYPNARFVALYRDGEEVVASWGARWYGFGKKVSWGEVKTKKLSYLAGINIFTRKWHETIEAIERWRRTLNICVVSYRELLVRPQNTLKVIFDHIELPYESYLAEIQLNSLSDWKDRIPLIYQPYLRHKVRRGNSIIREAERRNRILTFNN